MSVTGIFELELFNFDLNLFYMENTKLKDKVVDAFKTLVNNAEQNPYCRFGLDHTANYFINEYDNVVQKGKAGKIDWDFVMKYFRSIAVYASPETYESMRKTYVKNDKDITDKEFVRIMKLFLKKPELREIFMKYCP